MILYGFWKICGKGHYTYKYLYMILPFKFSLNYTLTYTLTFTYTLTYFLQRGPKRKPLSEEGLPKQQTFKICCGGHFPFTFM